ncbi:hypothetical protein AIIKEEIJ_00239 [Rhodococcus sp. YH1]|nr:hypothetical protein [Rhodococcus sp. YH1]
MTTLTTATAISIRFIRSFSWSSASAHADGAGSETMLLDP